MQNISEPSLLDRLRAELEPRKYLLSGLFLGVCSALVSKSIASDISLEVTLVVGTAVSVGIVAVARIISDHADKVNESIDNGGKVSVFSAPLVASLLFKDLLENAKDRRQSMEDEHEPRPADQNKKRVFLLPEPDEAWPASARPKLILLPNLIRHCASAPALTSSTATKEESEIVPTSPKAKF